MTDTEKGAPRQERAQPDADTTADAAKATVPPKLGDIRSTNRMALKDAAEWYVHNGYEVFPLRAYPDSGCKYPATTHGHLDATTDADRVIRYWSRRPSANIGLRPAADVVAIDVDPRHGGLDSILALEGEYGALPDTCIAMSGRGDGGMHLYFRFSYGDTPLTDKHLGPGVDLKRRNGYLVAPPSVHPDSGCRYQWYDGPCGGERIAACPLWLAGLLLTPSAKPRPQGLTESAALTGYLRAAVERECASVAAAASGTRNNTLVRAAFSLGQLVGDGLDEHAATAELVAAALSAGLAEEEAQRTIASGIAAGKRTPRKNGATA